MTDEFLTMGLQNDRYLKATRLVDQFEDGIELELRELGDRIIAENPELFAADVDGTSAYGQSSGSTLAYKRVDYPIDRLQSRESDVSLTLNVHLYWVEPKQYGRTDIDGAVRAFGYKVKNANEDGEARVAAETRDWDGLSTAADPYGSQQVFYGHVSSATDIENLRDRLVDHFSTFAGEYGVVSDD